MVAVKHNKVTIVKVTDVDGGQIATYYIRTGEGDNTRKSFGWKMRQTKMMPLWKFRETYVPAEGLWTNYFRCNKCEWERRTIAYCKYCDTPMSEIGAPGQIIHEVNGTPVWNLRSDLLQKVREKQECIGNAKPTSKVEGIRVFNIADLK